MSFQLKWVLTMFKILKYINILLADNIYKMNIKKKTSTVIAQGISYGHTAKVHSPLFAPFQKIDGIKSILTSVKIN